MTNLSGDSLSGQNKGRRAAGTGSSPVLPNKSERTRLWNRLRRIDSLCQHIKKCRVTAFVYGPEEIVKTDQWFNKHDNERKEIRLKLKGYK